MKIGIISDIHANVYGLRAVLEKLKDTDIILCAGDIIGYYTFVNEVFDELRKNKVIFIKGNHDRIFLGDEKTSIKLINDSLKLTREIISKNNLSLLKKAGSVFQTKLGGLRIGLYHESPWGKNFRVYPNFKEFDKFKKIEDGVIILGHTHYPLVKKAGKKIIINPGSCGQPRDNNPKASLAILDTETGKVVLKRVAYDQFPVIEAVRNHQLSQALIDILKRGQS